MIQELLQANLVEFTEGLENWEDAIRRSSESLLRNGYISQDYVDEIIASIKVHGPYILLLPEVAMPHASVGSKGVFKTGISLTIFTESIAFAPHKNARIFFTMATNDADVHLSNIQKLMALLIDDDKLARILNARCIEDLKGV